MAQKCLRQRLLVGKRFVRSGNLKITTTPEKDSGTYVSIDKEGREPFSTSRKSPKFLLCYSHCWRVDSILIAINWCIYFATAINTSHKNHNLIDLNIFYELIQGKLDFKRLSLKKWWKETWILTGYHCTTDRHWLPPRLMSSLDRGSTAFSEDSKRPFLFWST